MTELTVLQVQEPVNHMTGFEQVHTQQLQPLQGQAERFHLAASAFEAGAAGSNADW